MTLRHAFEFMRYSKDWGGEGRDFADYMYVIIRVGLIQPIKLLKKLQE